MRRIVFRAALLIGVLAQTGALRAGVYNLDAPRKYPSDFAQVNALDPIWRVLVHVGELRAVHDLAKVPYKADSLRTAYEKQLAKLEDRQRDGMLTPTDRVNMGACLIRMGRYAKARGALEESLRVVPSDSSVYFLLLFNLASAYQEEDALLQRAIDMQTQGLRSWPALFPGWNRGESTWYRHAEQYALKLMRLRLREQGRSRNELPPLDPLFGDVRFVGPSGSYEAGGIAFAQWSKLPVEAEMITLQLLLWRPHDPRLNWLYGELLNVRGQIDWAFSVLDFCKQLASNRELRQHHLIIRESVPVYKELFADSSGSGANLRKQALLLWALSPRGALLAPAIGIAANEIGGVAATTDPAALSVVRPPQALSSAPPTDSPRSGMVLPDWRQLAVSFITGIIVAILGVLQWQQWRRPRRDDTATSVRTEGVGEQSR